VINQSEGEFREGNIAQTGIIMVVWTLDILWRKVIYTVMYSMEFMSRIFGADRSDVWPVSDLKGLLGIKGPYSHVRESLQLGI
jgi:hypothetical protein